MRFCIALIDHPEADPYLIDKTYKLMKRSPIRRFINLYKIYFINTTSPSSMRNLVLTIPFA